MRPMAFTPMGSHWRVLRGGLPGSDLSTLVVVWRTGCRGQGQKQEAHVGDQFPNQVRADGRQADRGEEASNSRYVLEVELTWFIDGLDAGQRESLGDQGLCQACTQDTCLVPVNPMLLPSTSPHVPGRLS